MIVKISITDLNIAQNEKDNARRGYFKVLQTLWSYFYEIRQLTLYDFLQETNI
jgi:outer membrane protein